MIKQSLVGFSVLISLAGSLSFYAAYADETTDNSGIEGIQTMVDPDQASPAYQGQPYFNNTQPPTQPNGLSIPVQPQTTPTTVPWYKRLFGQAQTHAHAPINQPKKYPKEQARLLPPVPQPLVRLSKGVSYGGQTVAPGFYLIGLQPEGPFLTLIKQQQELIRIPAQVSTVAAMPEPPKPKGRLGKAQTQAPPEAGGWISFSPDSKSIVLTYQQGTKQYNSMPLSVTDDYAP